MDHIFSDAPFPYSRDCSDYPESHYYYYYCFYCCVSCHSLFRPETFLLEPTVITPNQALRPDCSISRTISGAPSTAVFCSESIECCTGMVSKFLFKKFVSIPVAPIITSLIIHFMFHIRFTSVCKLLYFLLNSFLLPFPWHSWWLVLSYISVFVFSFFLYYYYYYIWPIFQNFSTFCASLFNYYYYYLIKI